MTVSCPETKLFATQHDLPESTRRHMIEDLNSTLATLVDLKFQLKQAHWNVKGIHFVQLHELFDALAGEVDGYVDLVAERATTLGGYAYGTVRDAAEHSVLPEYPVEAVHGKDHLQLLVERYATVAQKLRGHIDEASQAGDQGTADLFTEISRGVDLRLWFLESHLI